MKKINLCKLNKFQIDKKQQQLIFGGNACLCGSCGKYATRYDNAHANFNRNITGTGTNHPIVCACNKAPFENNENSVKAWV